MRYLKIRSLDRSWHDRDAILLHAAFQVLCDFMEEEKPGRRIDWSHNQEHAHAWAEIRSLYTWWRSERPSRRGPLDDKRLKRPPLEFEGVPGTPLSRLKPYDKETYRRYTRALRDHAKLERRWNAEDQRNLHRLVKVRGFLWT